MKKYALNSNAVIILLLLVIAYLLSPYFQPQKEYRCIIDEKGNAVKVNEPIPLKILQ